MSEIEYEDEDNEDRQCRDCGATFTMSGRARDWFLMRNMMLPRRCRRCLDARRAEREA